MTADTWSKVLSVIEPEINRQTFISWFKDTQALDVNGSTLTIKVADNVAKQLISEQFSREVEGAIEKVTGKKYLCEYVTNEFSLTKPIKDVSDVSGEQINRNGYNENTILNPDYTFNNFVTGSNNDYAYTAAKAIAENPGQYGKNPLFIYGSSGLGKTHLLQAIGNEVLEKKAYLNVRFVSTERFISEFITSIQTRTQESFKIKYRNVDILLIDDIQFLENKEGTQDEFFHTFNALHDSKKQIVISSDRPPLEIPNLTDRLQTRFRGGLIIDIKPPDLETRVAILRKKAQKVNVIILDDAYYYIARHIKSSIRELEAAINRLQMVADMQKEPLEITVEHAKIHLKDFFDIDSNKKITIVDIIQKVSEKFNVTAEEIKSKSRHDKIIIPRHTVMYLTRNYINDMTMDDIGKEIGNRDHSTVVSAVKKIETMMVDDTDLKEKINDIIEELKS
jgi:chromosomal replication initiator protein